MIFKFSKIGEELQLTGMAVKIARVTDQNITRHAPEHQAYDGYHIRSWRYINDSKLEKCWPVLRYEGGLDAPNGEAP